MLVGGSVSLVQTSPQIGGVFVALLPTMAIVANGLSYGLRNMRHTASRSAGNANAVLTEAVTNVRVIHSFTAEAHTKQKYHKALSEASTAKVRLATATGSSSSVRARWTSVRFVKRLVCCCLCRRRRQRRRPWAALSACLPLAAGGWQWTI